MTPAMEFERHAVGDVDIRVARVHQGDRPTAVLTNAFPQSIRCWESLWGRLAAHLDLLAVDLAGFGYSTGSPAVMRPSAQAAMLAELLDVFEIDRAFLVGPDIGVPVTLWLAADHPDRVLAVNVFDGPATWPTDFDPALRAATRSRLVRWLGNRPPLRRRLMTQNFEVATSGGYRHFKPSDAAADEYRSICFDVRQHQHSLEFLGSYAEELPQLEKRLPSIDTPVLITWGADDRFVRPGNAERLDALLPNSELTVFANAGHFSHEDADERWLERFLAFVETNRPTPGTTTGSDRP